MEVTKRGRAFYWNFLLCQIEIVFHRLPFRGWIGVGMIVRRRLRIGPCPSSPRRHFPSPPFSHRRLPVLRAIRPSSKLSPFNHWRACYRVAGAFSRKQFASTALASDLNYRHVHQSLRYHIVRRTLFHFRSFAKFSSVSRENILRRVRTVFAVIN